MLPTEQEHHEMLSTCLDPSSLRLERESRTNRGSRRLGNIPENNNRTSVKTLASGETGSGSVRTTFARVRCLNCFWWLLLA